MLKLEENKSGWDLDEIMEEINKEETSYKENIILLLNEYISKYSEIIENESPMVKSISNTNEEDEVYVNVFSFRVKISYSIGSEMVCVKEGKLNIHLYNSLNNKIHILSEDFGNEELVLNDKNIKKYFNSSYKKGLSGVPSIKRMHEDYINKRKSPLISPRGKKKLKRVFSSH